MTAYVITYRLEKGERITKAEYDASLRNLDERVIELETNPVQPNGINNISVTSNLMTITLDDYSTFGPFSIPVPRWHPKGVWQALTLYFALDLIRYNGSLYQVLLTHTSDIVFDEQADQGSGFLYGLLVPAQSSPYDIVLTYDHLLPSSEAVVAVHVAVRGITIAAMFSGSRAFIRVATSASPITLPIYLNNDIIGTLQFIPGQDTTMDGGQFGSFSALDTGDISIAAGDRVSIALPYEDDPTAQGLFVTLKGTASLV